MPDELPDHLDRLPSTPSPELEDEVRIGNVKYKRIDEKEEQNPSGERDDSPSPAQQATALVTGPGTLWMETEDGWIPLGKIGPATTTAGGYTLCESRQPETGAREEHR